MTLSPATRFLMLAAVLALVSTPLHAQHQDTPIPPPKFFPGLKQAWTEDHKLPGAIGFVGGKIANIPRNVAVWVTGTSKAAVHAPPAPKHPKQHKPKQRKHHKPRGKMGQKFHDWKQRIVQWFKDQGCNAKDGWYLARHPEVDVSFCDGGAEENAPSKSCDEKDGVCQRPKRPSPPRPQPPKGCNVRTGQCLASSRHVSHRSSRHHHE